MKLLIITTLLLSSQALAEQTTSMEVPCHRQENGAHLLSPRAQERLNAFCRSWRSPQSIAVIHSSGECKTVASIAGRRHTQHSLVEFSCLLDVQAGSIDEFFGLPQ